MCDYSGRLIAWLDHELPENEAADLEGHVRACAECRTELVSYKRVSRAFAAYSDAVCDSASGSAISSKTPRKSPRWIPALLGAAAIVVVVLLLTFSRKPVEQPRSQPQAAAAHSTVVSASVPGSISAPGLTNVIAPAKRTRRKRLVSTVQSQNNIWVPAEPAIQIAIPAEAMFPPGAVPEGVNFIGDLNIGADGSVQLLRLQPRLAVFERRTTQP